MGGNLLVLSCTRRGGVDRLGPRLRLPPAVSVCLVGFTCFGGREKCEGFDSERFKYRNRASAEKVVVPWLLELEIDQI